MPSSRKTLPEISDSVSSRVSRALRKAASARLSAFTLAELIVVVAILAVLATIGFLALSGYREDAKDSVIKTNVRSVYAAIAAESTTLQKSARCFIRHSPTHALTGGAIVMFDGGVADALV
jgi:prepilin-type N-terminal cleavage/methylation domain-containing protein